MDKQIDKDINVRSKMIEEMAKGYCKNSYSCNKNCTIQKTEICTCYEVCELLYNACYRKADDLLKELQSMKSDFAKDMLEIKETYEKEVVDLVNEVRKETAEKFARLVEFHSVSTRDEDGRKIFTISALGLKEILNEEFGISYDEICEEITEDCK